MTIDSGCLEAHLQTHLQAAATALLAAEAAPSVIAPLRLADTGADLADAYAVQRITAQRRVEAGARRIGRKVAMTSTAAQRQFGISTPAVGVLHAPMLQPPGQPLVFDRLLQPRVEAELAFVLRADIDQPEPNLIDVLRAIDFALVAIEVAECRIEGWAIDVIDFVADNAAAGRVVLSETPLDIRNIDLRAVEMTMQINGEQRGSGCGAACLGSPLLSLLWLARCVAPQAPLARGELVMSGALGTPLAVSRGDRVALHIGNFPPLAAQFD